MIIRLACENDTQNIAKLDSHIPIIRLDECIRNGQAYILLDENNGSVVGVLRYSLFWQTIPFLDFIYIDDFYRHKGYGSKMMQKWEGDMQAHGYKYIMTSTQADEDAWAFYEKLGYHKSGGFFPPEQEAEEWIYFRELG